MLKYLLPLCLLVTIAHADDAAKPKTLTVRDAVQISNGLANMSCASRVLKDAGNEKMGCDPYQWSPGMSWRISDYQHRVEDVARRYYRLRNEALAALPRTDGKLSGDDEAKFALRDADILDQDAGLTLEPFKRSELEPMKLPPAVLAALWSIIEAPDKK
jgi:hypothetical protein